MGLFDFLKRKQRMQPDELGNALASVLISLWTEKITEHTEEYGNHVARITDVERNDLWQLFFLLHCTAVSVGVESCRLNARDEKLILDTFWNRLLQLFCEGRLEKELIELEQNIDRWYPTLREQIIQPGSSRSSPGTLGPGKVLFNLALPKRDMLENMVLISRLTAYFLATSQALTQFAANTVKEVQLSK